MRKRMKEEKIKGFKNKKKNEKDNVKQEGKDGRERRTLAN